MKLSFVPPNDPVLTKIAEPLTISEIKEEIYQELINSMFSLANGEQTNNSRLVGLAAPQIGFSKRIILVDLIADGIGKRGGLELFINPEIVWQSMETEEFYEGCFSTDEIRGILDRSTEIKVNYLNLKGENRQDVFKNYTARIFQHEVDHINGKDFITYITDENKLHWVKWEEMKKYRKNNAWRDWPIKATFEQWRKIKTVGK